MDSMDKAMMYRDVFCTIYGLVAGIICGWCLNTIYTAFKYALPRKKRANESV